MANLKFELKLRSASNIKDLRQNPFAKMKVYARIVVNDDAKTVAETPVDMNGGTNPVWNCTAKYIINKSDVQRDGTMLTVQLYYRRSLRGDGYIGEVRVPLRELFQRSPGDGGELLVEYPVKKDSADSKQMLYFSYSFTGMTNSETMRSDWMLRFIELGWIIVQIITSV